jgi:hypothetical protein
MTPKRIVTITDARTTHRYLTNGMRVTRALAALGHDVRRIDHKHLAREVLAGADFILAFGTVVRAEMETGGYFKAIQTLKDKDAISALWYFDMCNPRQQHSPYKPKFIREAARTFDWLFTTDHSYPWETVAKNYMHLTQGVDPADFTWVVRPPEPRASDVIFTGGRDRYFTYRGELINMLRTRFRVSAFGRGYASIIHDRDFFAAHQRSRTVLVPEPPAEARDHYWSNRIYLATATGTPAVVGYVPGIEDHFEDGKEVVFYHDRNEMVQAVAALVADPDRRKEMGDAARKRTLTEHTYGARCTTMMERIWPN